MIRKSRLRWFGHVERNDDNDWVKRCITREVEGIRQRGCRKKTWWDCVKNDMESLCLSQKNAQSRNKTLKRSVYIPGFDSIDWMSRRASNLQKLTTASSLQRCPFGEVKNGQHRKTINLSSHEQKGCLTLSLSLFFLIPGEPGLSGTRMSHSGFYWNGMV